MSFLSFPSGHWAVVGYPAPSKIPAKKTHEEAGRYSHAVFSAVKIFFTVEDNGGSWYVPAYKIRQSANAAKDAVNFGMWESFHSVTEIRLAPDVAGTLARGWAARTAAPSGCHF